MKSTIEVKKSMMIYNRLKFWFKLSILSNLILSLRTIKKLIFKRDFLRILLDFLGRKFRNFFFQLFFRHLRNVLTKKNYSDCRFFWLNPFKLLHSQKEILRSFSSVSYFLKRCPTMSGKALGSPETPDFIQTRNFLFFFFSREFFLLLFQ